MEELLQEYSDNLQAQNFLKLIDSYGFVFLTGKAGTGKSTLLGKLVKILKGNAIVLAPTGIAAINVGGQTIHSFFQIAPRPYLPTESFGDEYLKEEKIEIIKNAKIIIIDEISMVRCDLMNAIDTRLQQSMKNKLPFGGKQLLVVGDLFQLPPIKGKKDEMVTDVIANEDITVSEFIDRHYTTPYFWSAKILGDGFKPIVIELEKVYRQSDAKFINLLDSVREDTIDEIQLRELNKRFIHNYEPEMDSFELILCAKNDMADGKNAKRLKEIKNKLHEFVADLERSFLKYDQKKTSNFPADLILDVKEGAQIMFIKNDMGGRWVNGTIGKIVSIDLQNNQIEIQIRGRDGSLLVSRETWEDCKYYWDKKKGTIAREVMGEFKQFPITLAWAITIHKSQGLTFDDVVINLGMGAFENGQTYVALSRCRTFEGIKLQTNIGFDDIRVDDKVRNFMNDARKWITDEKIKEAMIKGLKNKTNELINENEILINKSTEFKSKIAELNTTVENKTKSIESIENEKQILNLEISKLNTELENLKNKNNAINNEKINELEEKLKNISTENNNKSNIIESVKKDIESAQFNLNELQTQINKLKVENENLTKKLSVNKNEFESKINELNREIYELSEKNTVANEYIRNFVAGNEPNQKTGKMLEISVKLELDTLLKAWEYMIFCNETALTYDENRDICKYVHSTARGHEAIQLAVGMQLLPQDFVYPYYRDEAIMFGIGTTPYENMLQLLAKRDDPFSGGRMYYAHPSLNRADKPKIPYQASATGMQAIPATGAAQGIKYKEIQGLAQYAENEAKPVVVCSLGDGAITEGEVSEAFQMAVLHQLPIIYLIQDNGWSISASSDEFRAMNAVEFAQGFKGLEVAECEGNDFMDCYTVFAQALATVRQERRPMMVYAPVSLIGHHTSGVRREWYRKEDLEKALENDPFIVFKQQLLEIGLKEEMLNEIEARCRKQIRDDFQKAVEAEEPTIENLHTFYYKPTPIVEEKGVRTPVDGKEVVMVDAALHAMDDLMNLHPECVLYGQDVGGRLGGVFREAATLAEKHGKNRVFNTPIQEAYIIGSTSGMSAVGCLPVVEVQFADYIFPGINQLFTELSRSYYLSYGKWNINALIRVPIGAYGCGGPFHSSSVESFLLNIKGIKVVYPSNAADLKGLFKAAFYDPNPVVMLEHKGLYWSKVPGSKEARTIEPDSEYIIPLGKGRIYQASSQEELDKGNTCVIITYGMGVHWAKNASANFPGSVEIVDLRTLEPLDWELISEVVLRHNKVMVLTEENPVNSFAEALSGSIMRHFFQNLDAPVMLIGSENTPAIPVNQTLENLMLPNAEKVAAGIEALLNC